MEIMTNLEILEGIQADTDTLLKAKALLSGDCKLVDGSPTQEKVKSVLPTLRARKETSKIAGVKIYGLEQLIVALSELDDNTTIFGYGFKATGIAGNFYFVEPGNKRLGMAIVVI